MCEEINEILITDAIVSAITDEYEPDDEGFIEIELDDLERIITQAVESYLDKPSIDDAMSDFDS